MCVYIISCQGPKYQEIVNIRLGDGTTRRGQVLEVDGEKAVVQVYYSLASLMARFDFRLFYLLIIRTFQQFYKN